MRNKDDNKHEHKSRHKKGYKSGYRRYGLFQYIMNKFDWDDLIWFFPVLVIVILVWLADIPIKIWGGIVLTHIILIAAIWSLIYFDDYIHYLSRGKYIRKIPRNGSKRVYSKRFKRVSFILMLIYIVTWCLGGYFLYEKLFLTREITSFHLLVITIVYLIVVKKGTYGKYTTEIYFERMLIWEIIIGLWYCFLLSLIYKHVLNMLTYVPLIIFLLSGFTVPGLISGNIKSVMFEVVISRVFGRFWDKSQGLAKSGSATELDDAIELDDATELDNATELDVASEKNIIFKRIILLVLSSVVLLSTIFQMVMDKSYIEPVSYDTDMEFVSMLYDYIAAEQYYDKQYNEAIDSFSRAAFYSPTNASYYYWLSICYCVRGAEGDFYRAIECGLLAMKYSIQPEYNIEYPVENFTYADSIGRSIEYLEFEGKNIDLDEISQYEEALFLWVLQYEESEYTFAKIADYYFEHGEYVKALDAYTSAMNFFIDGTYGYINYEYISENDSNYSLSEVDYINDAIDNYNKKRDLYIERIDYCVEQLCRYSDEEVLIND